MKFLLALATVLIAGPAAAAEVDTSAAMLTGQMGLVPWLTALPIMLPILGAALTLTLRARTDLQLAIALLALGLAALAAVAQNAAVAATGPIAMAAGNWLPPFGIVLAVDALGALLVLVTTLVGLVGLAYARVDIGPAGVRFGLYPLYLLLIGGVAGAFSTGDIFNLYVWFEVFLVASFGLIVLGGAPRQLDGAVKYGVLNLIATTVFLIAVGALYGLTGTLNMADIRGVVAGLDGGPIGTVGALFVLAFAMKAAAFPLHMWLPASYHTPRVIVAALFAGLLTKVGVYSLMRIMVMLFGDEGEAYLPLLAALGVLTAVIGALGAIAQVELRRMAAFLVVSGVGVMLIGVGLGTLAGLSGAIVYAVHSIIAMTTLFLVLGAVERVGGGWLTAGGDVYAGAGLLAAIFLIAGFSAAGLPPFSGFWPKLMLIEASLAETGWIAPAGALGVILSGIFTTIAVGRAWALVFLKPAASAASETPNRLGASLALPLTVMAAFVVGLGLFPGIVLDPAEAGAAGLLDPTAYVERVIGGPADGEPGPGATNPAPADPAAATQSGEAAE